MAREKGKTGKPPKEAKSKKGRRQASSSVSRGHRDSGDDASDDDEIELESISRSDVEQTESLLESLESVDSGALRGDWLDGLPTDALQSRLTGDEEPTDDADLPEPIWPDDDFGVGGFGAAGFGFGVRRVIGRDDRVRILRESVRQAPYRWICYLSIVTANGARVRGTGWLVGPRTVLTAGHCVWDKQRGNDFSRSIIVYPARDGDYKPLSSRESNLHTVTEWARRARPGAAFDYGAITLEKPLGVEVGHFGIANFPDTDLRGFKLNVAGYPGDKPGSHMWAHAQLPRTVDAQTVQYVIDTYSGQSGSPVFIREGDDYTAVGIHNSGTSRLNFATRINSAVFRQIKEWKDR